MTYDAIIQAAGQQLGVDPDLIRAIIQVESGGNPNAYRSEPQIKDASYGLMQLLLGTARSVSGKASMTAVELLQPNVNVLLGTKYLSDLQAKYGKLEDTIASYNAGRPVIQNGKYVNQAYVNKVLWWLWYYKHQAAVLLIPAVGLGVFLMWWFRKKRG